MTPEPHPVAMKAAEWAVQREIAPLVERIARFVEGWGSGTLSRLAADIRREFMPSVAVEAEQVHAVIVETANAAHEGQ